MAINHFLSTNQQLLIHYAPQIRGEALHWAVFSITPFPLDPVVGNMLRLYDNTSQIHLNLCHDELQALNGEPGQEENKKPTELNW